MIVRRRPVLHIFLSRPAYPTHTLRIGIIEIGPLQLPRPSRYTVLLGSALDFTRSSAELVAKNSLLRQQLIILHRQVHKPRFTPTDRLWLVLLASRIRSWKEAIIILKPDTLLRWHCQGFRLFCRFRSRNRGSRPTAASESTALIQQMVKENSPWGVERIRGELMILGIRVPEPQPRSTFVWHSPHPAHDQNWPTFLKNHARMVRARDFLAIIDLFFRQFYAFFISELASRRIIQFGVASHPTDPWVAQQLRETTPYGLTPRFLIGDRDSKHGDDFAQVAKASSIEVLKTPHRAPKANAVCERFLGSVRRECLDHVLVVGDRQLHRVIKEYVEHFDQARPHQGIRQRIPVEIGPQPAWPRRGALITVPALNGLQHPGSRAS